MVKIAVVGCTGQLGSSIMKRIMNRADIEWQFIKLSGIQ